MVTRGVMVFISLSCHDNHNFISHCFRVSLSRVIMVARIVIVVIVVRVATFVMVVRVVALIMVVRVVTDIMTHLSQ